MSSLVQKKLEDYFASVNPTSNRMMADILSSREECKAFETLPFEEQSDVIWRAIVKSEAVSKYEKFPQQKADVDSFPVLRIRPGAKVIVDEDTSAGKTFGNTWRDEHSAPFRWETQSQLDLRLDAEESDTERIKTLEKKEISKSKESVLSDSRRDDEVKRSNPIKRPAAPPPPVPPHALPVVPPHSESPPVPAHSGEKGETPIYAKVVKRKSAAKTLVISEMKAHRRAKEEMKPAVPPRMSLELKGEFDVSKYKTLPIDFDDIPKTGFDFLDNW